MWTKSDWFEWAEIARKDREKKKLEEIFLIRQERIKKLKQLNGK